MLEGSVSKKGWVLIYTRTPVNNEYSTNLAYSAHLAYSRDAIHFEPLNQNYGILFASATYGERNTLNEKGLISPYLFRTADGVYGVIAVRVNADGSRDPESRGSVLIWVSEDFCHFNEIGLINLKKDVFVRKVTCRYDCSAHKYFINWCDEDGNCYRNEMTNLSAPSNVSDTVPGDDVEYTASNILKKDVACGNVLEVDANFGDRLASYWEPLRNVSIQVPCLIRASSGRELDTVRATAVYSDGSTALKQVMWDTQNVDFSKPGCYRVTGTVVSNEYSFPLAKGFADPDILRWKGRYYFIATNDNLNDVGLYVRESDSVHGLFEENTKQHLILGRDESKNFIQTFWAPEFHVIGGELWLLFAVGGKIWGPQSYMMKLKKDGSILAPDGWEEPVRVIKKDGANLAEDGITLDMTYFDANKRCYLVWSYRQNISTPYDSGSMLYIASIDPAMPWRLTSEPVLLSRPLFGWKNNEHTINNEGPYALVTKDHIFLTYSGGAAGGYTYVLGLLTAGMDGDLLNPNSWMKSSTPVLSYYSVKGEYGPGHNSFFQDADGNIMIAYHAQNSLKSNLRCTGIRRMHFNVHGVPIFDLSADRDLNVKLANVQTEVLVE